MDMILARRFAKETAIERNSTDVSVIIPVLNESTCIAAAIADLRRQGPGEIIVVDGGSSDATVALSQGADRVLATPTGRAAQMNAGAAAASGELLLFLHADCRLQTGALEAAARCLQRPGVVAVCFAMRVQAPGLCYRCIDAAADLRVRLTGIAYGDQGLCLRRCDFERLGGFPPLRFMEDVFLSRALRRRGRILVLPQRIEVSPRRWQKAGLLRQTLRNWALTGLALAGMSPDRLAEYYPLVR